MKQRMAHAIILVNDYDEAIKFYTKKLDFTLLEDTRRDENKRWVMIAPPGSSECTILLAKATNERQSTNVGNQTGGKVGFFLFTDDFWRDYNNMVAKNIRFTSEPVKHD